MNKSTSYEWIRENFEPQQLNWYSVNDCLPKIREDDFGFHQSETVLVYLEGGLMFTAFLRRYEDFDPDWILLGRDGYIAENVTHWRWLPMMP